jgi:hypothetical protein
VVAANMNLILNLMKAEVVKQKELSDTDVVAANFYGSVA